MKNKKDAKKKNKSKSLARKIAIFIGRFFLWLFSTVIVLIIGLYIMLMYVNKGPSPYVRDLFVTSVMESSAGGILAEIYLTDEEIAAIQQKNATQTVDTITDTTLIHFEAASSNTANVIGTEEQVIDPDGDGIDIFDVHGPTYNGKMMIVYDASRVKVGVIDHFSLEIPGMTLMEIVEKYGCVAGVNGGKYNDEAGLGTGAMPEGIVISEGQLLMGDLQTTYGVYGFNEDNVLVVGNMTAGYAQSIGIRDAVSFGPALIVNGVPANVSGSSSGLNPRTAIGQRADGAVLLLVIEGRQANSIGATMADLINVMTEYGAVNAANLDGGMSSTMVYNGEQIIDSCSFTSARRIPTAFIVEPLEEE